MKCLQCGTELDRLSKWRGSSEYCSEECKKQSTEEFNRLAMSRLMRPRPARANARPATGAVRTVESSAGPLTVVTHPVGASSPIMTEPPEAGFLFQAAVETAETHPFQQPPVPPASVSPVLPEAGIELGNSLLALQRILAGMRPARRLARPFAPGAAAFLVNAAAPPPLRLPSCEPVWPPSLGVQFAVEGLSGPSAQPASAAPLERIGTPVSHSAIPARRSSRPLPPLPPFDLGADRLILPPAVSSPRLRIHLPKPFLNPLRPRYAFAPAPGSSPAMPGTPEPEIQAAEPEIQAVEPEIQAVEPEIQAVEPEIPLEAIPIAPAADDAAAPAETPAPPARPVEKPAPAREPERQVAAPTFGASAGAGDEPAGWLARIPGWAKVVAALALLAGGAAYWGFGSWTARAERKGTLPAAAAATMGPESWETDSTGDTTGIARRRIVSLYKPARGKRNYSIEFSGLIEEHALGWVFRVKDPRNYYCLKLERSAAGSGLPQLVKFAVVDGEEQPHRLVPLKEPLAEGRPVKIRLDVQGQNFSTAVNGRPVDVWIDSQIAEGTVGFSNESGERAVISTVKVTY
jgi:hypothetical protein